MAHMKRGRPRKLTDAQERVLIEELRFARHFTHKKISGRYGLTLKTLENYATRARQEGRL